LYNARRRDKTTTLSHRKMAKRVVLKNRQLEIQPRMEDVMVVAEGTQVAQLPDEFEVVDCEGKRVEPTHDFYVTAETMDPEHMLLDWDGMTPGFSGL
jgi:hypothetical protein